MAFEQQVIDIFANYGWMAVFVLLAVFGLGMLGLLAFFWQRGKIPLFYSYKIPYILREKRGEYLMPVRIGKARAYKADDGNTYYALKTGFMGEIKGVPAPDFRDLYPNNWAEFLALNRDEHYSVVNNGGEIITDAAMIGERRIVPLKNVTKGIGELNAKMNSERWKSAFVAGERARLDRQQQDKWYLQILPYAMIFITIVGCFLIVAVLAEPMIVISGQAATATAHYRAASEANLKIVQMQYAGKNGTVPFPSGSEKPGDAG